MTQRQRRLLLIALFTFSLFALLIAQFFKIQITEGEKWKKLALAQHECIISEPAMRGTFFANGSIKKGDTTKAVALAMDLPKSHLFIDPLSIPSAYKRPLVEKLCTLLHCNAVEKKTLLQECHKNSHCRRIAWWLDLDTKNQILAWWQPFAKKRKIASNALYFTTDYKRSYPYGKLLGQVLHTIRELKDEKTQEGIPTGGLETYFNDTLKGCAGKRKLLRSPLNPLETDETLIEAKRGEDVYLSINHCLQAIVEEELEKGVLAAKAKSGWSVMIDPATGEILALAQYPFFEPARYKDYFNDPLLLKQTKIQAITDAFELGSIMKPITLAIALKANEELKAAKKPPLFNPDEMMKTTRCIFPGRAHKPLVDGVRHQYLNANLAIQKSSNVYMAEIVDRIISTMGADWYRKQLTETFGFSTKTGIELPGETTGHVPTIGKQHASGAPEWSTSTPYSLCIGYNLMATSLQMIRAYAMLVNGGLFVKPTLLHPLSEDPNTHTTPSFPRHLSSEISKIVFRAMKYTTKSGGTAVLAEIPGYSDGGKTGTAEKIVNGAYVKTQHISSFIGFAPARENICPRFVLLVTIDEPEYRIAENGAKLFMGSRCAAPVFREIARRSLEYMGVTPDDPAGYPRNDPRFNGGQADWFGEVQALKQLYDEYNKKR